MKTNNRLSLESKIGDLYATPVGHDAIAKVLNKKVYKHYFGLVLIAEEIDKTFKLTTNEAENVIKKFY